MKKLDYHTNFIDEMTFIIKLIKNINADMYLNR